VRVRLTSVESGTGEPHDGLVLVEDISETREAERIRREFDALKDGFIRVVSHDLQGPLISIGGLAEFLSQRGEENEDRAQALRRIASNAERLRRMVASFLDVDRLYQGGVKAIRRPTDLADVVEGVVKAIDRAEHPLEVEVEPLVAHLDRNQVEQILENLLENAFTHTPPGTPVRLSVAKDGDAVLISVEDSGDGVPEDLAEVVFELFQTGKALGRRTGIGLWVVGRFAELHGGRAWVESRLGGGASFQVLLPTIDEVAGEAR
jgi:two-component system OmpR family sensor kinase